MYLRVDNFSGCWLVFILWFISEMGAPDSKLSFDILRNWYLTINVLGYIIQAGVRGWRRCVQVHSCLLPPVIIANMTAPLAAETDTS
jgi:hypothetical protein